MGDPPTPQPPPMHPSIPMLYYGLIRVGTAIIFLALYHFLIRFVSAEYTNHQRTTQGMGRAITWRSFHTSVSSFKYRKDTISQDDRDDTDCEVCFSAFEEDEDLRQLHRCKHTFHAPCIDMWLYSHMDCPLCRTPVEPPPEAHSDHSHQGLLGSVYYLI